MKVHNITLQVLGVGQSYTGHGFKDEKVSEYLQDLAEDALVLFIDAFDSVLMRGVDMIVTRYRELVATSNASIVVSEENIERCGFLYT
jgi:hypothetical protein